MGYSWSQQDESVGAGFKRMATEQIAKAVLNADAVNDPPAGRIQSARRSRLPHLASINEALEPRQG